MEIDKIDIHELLPQREPFVMVGRMVYFDMGRCATRTRIAPGNLFVEKGRFTASGIIENIAQTCAARLGYINYIRRETIRLGFIGAVRGCRILRRPHTGETIHTGIRVMEEVMGLTLVWATITDDDGQVMAEGQMKIAVSEKPAQMAQTAQAAPEEHTPKP